MIGVDFADFRVSDSFLSSCQYGDRCKFLHATQQQPKPSPFGLQNGTQFSHTSTQQQASNPFGFGVQNGPPQARGGINDFGKKQNNQFKVHLLPNWLILFLVLLHIMSWIWSKTLLDCFWPCRIFILKFCEIKFRKDWVMPNVAWYIVLLFCHSPTWPAFWKQVDSFLFYKCWWFYCGSKTW